MGIVRRYESAAKPSFSLAGGSPEAIAASTSLIL
jgi:hypothetical protein